MEIKSNYQKAGNVQSMPMSSASDEDLLADSPFIAGLRARFFTAGIPNWPTPGSATPGQLFDDLSAAARLLFLRCEDPTLAVTVSGTPGSALHILSGYLAPLTWPTAPPDVPEAWAEEGQFQIYRRYEVGRAVDVMLQAYSQGGGGSGGTGWPPKIPSLVVGPSP